MKDLAQRIDLTLLKADAAEKDIKKLCEDAKKFNFRGVCVNLDRIKLCSNELLFSNELFGSSDINLISVVDFPLGAGGLETKVYQAKIANGLGADEIDTVMNIGAFRDGDYRTVLDEIKNLVSIFRRKVKVIIETGHWDLKQALKAAELVEKSGAFCLKTSTGFEPQTTIKQKAIYIKEIKNRFPNLRVKAAGGIRALKDIKLLSSAGADIFGISSSYAQKIMEEIK